MKIPVLVVRELLPASEVAPTTPHVMSVWLASASSVKYRAYVFGAMPAPDQYTATRLRTTLPAHVIRGSQIGWYWVNSLLPLTTWLPPTKAIRDQLKVWPLIVDD